MFETGKLCFNFFFSELLDKNQNMKLRIVLFFDVTVFKDNATGQREFPANSLQLCVRDQ